MNKRKIDKNEIEQSQATKQAKILHVESTPEKTAMKFDFMLSLQNIVLAKIVKNLWMNQNTQEEIAKLFGSHIKPVHEMWGDGWNKIENNIVAKISQFSLPDFISSKLTYIVPAVGKSIHQWITHFDEVLVQASYCSEYGSKYFSVDLINNITWTARGKIDYAQTAKNILANPDICLSEDAKFNIACTYCLKDEATLLAPNVVNEYFLGNIGRFMRPMIHFWSTHITVHSIEETLRGEIEYMLYHQCDSVQMHLSINEVIFKILIKNNDSTERTFNEVAITCVWNTLTAEEKARNITALIEKMDDQGLKYTLLSNLKYEQQQDIFKECSSSILDGILEDWSWEEYFLPTALHFLDVMEPSEFFFILGNIIILKISGSKNKLMYNQYKSIFKELWKKCSRNLKDFFFEYGNGRFIGDFLSSLSWKENTDIIGLILNDLNRKQRKNVISGQYGVMCCSLLIEEDLWDFLELFITPSLFSDDDIIQFKQELVEKEGLWLAEQFLEQNALYKIEQFMTWAFNSQKEIDQFRKSLSHAVICKATLESIITHNKVDFTDLENHFIWCAKGDLKVINKFKTEVPKLFNDTFISHFIENERCDLLDKVLNWCFLDDEQKIVQFKSNMYKDEDLTSCFNSVIINLIEKDKSFRMLERFLHWCFTDEREIKNIKTQLLNPLEDFYSVCTKLLSDYDLDLADKFINWCITCSEEVCIYKNTLMLSKSDMEYILNSDGVDSQTDLQLLIKWFNPSKVTLQEFHSRLLVRKLYLYKEIKYEWLHEIIESLNSLKDNKESLISN